MAKRGAKSNSFLREKNLTIPLVATPSQEYLNKILRKDKYGRTILNRQSIISVFDANGIDRHLVFNASNLKYKTLSEAMKEVEEAIKEPLEDAGVFGVIEYHKADETQNSDHLHFWINTDDEYVKHIIRSIIVENEWSYSYDVDIQKYTDGQKIDESEMFELSSESLTANRDIVNEKTANYLLGDARSVSKDTKEDIFFRLDSLSKDVGVDKNKDVSKHFAIFNKLEKLDSLDSVLDNEENLETNRDNIKKSFDDIFSKYEIGGINENIVGKR
jgi:hypothetical protein